MARINHSLTHSNANNNQQQTNLLTKIEENTKNIKLEAETIDINVADLEALQTTANTTLAAILVDTDAADSSLNTIEAQSVLTASRLNNIQNKISANVDGTGDTLGQINSNILLKNTEIETSLNSILVDSTAIKTSVQLLDNAISGNEMQVDVLTMPTVAVTLAGGATEAKQDSGITHLATIAGDTTSIDGKITACNTGAVVVSSSALPSGAATQSTLNDAEVHLGSIDGKITACNTGAVVVSSSALPSGAATESSLSSLNGKVTACNTGAVVVSSSALPSGAATQSTLNDAEVHLGSIDGKITQGYDLQIASGGSGLQQNLIYGRDNSGNLDALKTDSSGHLEVVVDDFVKGQAAMAASFPVTIASNQSNLNVAIASGGFDGAVTNAGTFAVQAACSGTVTANLSATDNAVLDAIAADGDAIQTKLDTLETTLSNIETDQAALEVLHTATNSKIDTIDSQIDLLEGTNTIKDVEWLSSESISNQALSSVLDTEGYERVFIYGENSSVVSANNFKIFGSNASAGTYYSVGQLAVVTSDSGRYLLREDSPLHDGPSPRYLKVFNNTGSSQTITKLRAVMSHKLRYV